MKIWTLVENTACRNDLQAEHGLSLYIETGEHKILFDAGQSGAFADNAEKLGIDLSRVDFAVLSHGHYDHGGGLLRFLEINDTALIYVNRNAFGGHRNAAGKYIGLDQRLQGHDRLRFVDDVVQLAPGIILDPCGKQQNHYPLDSAGMTVLEDGQVRTEDFRHEQYLLITEGEKRVLFSGCSHRGILNIAQWFAPDVLVGGFHFMKVEEEARLEKAAKVLLSHKTCYYTGHCTGQSQYDFLKNRMGDRLHGLRTGCCLEICAKK